MGVCPHQTRMWGQNTQNSRLSLGRRAGCHCCGQSHDPRAGPGRSGLMVRHLHTTTSLLLFVNTLTLMLNHQLHPPEWNKRLRCVNNWDLLHTRQGEEADTGTARPNWQKLVNNKQEKQDQAVEEHISYDQESLHLTALQLKCNTKHSMIAFQFIWITQQENIYTHSLFSECLTQETI